MDKSKVRRQEHITAVEGKKEIEMALEGGFEFQSIFIQESIADIALIDRIHSANPTLEVYKISNDLFSKTAYRETSGGIVALVRTKEVLLKELRVKKKALVLIIDGVEKPGNLGAILRTADAADIDAVICSDMPGDIYNPNTIRASLGTIFTVPVIVADSTSIMQWLRTEKFKTYCSFLHKAQDYDNQDYTGDTALVMGTESTGVSKKWVEFSDACIKIPMLGKIDSLNVSVATAILVFEAKRQRKSNN